MGPVALANLAAVLTHRTVELCLDNAFALIEGHPKIECQSSQHRGPETT